MYKNGYQCSVCKSRRIVGRKMVSGLPGFRCTDCGDTSPHKVSDLEDAAKGKHKYMTIKEAAALLDDHLVLDPPTEKSPRKATASDELALNSIGGLSPNDVSAALSVIGKRPFGRLDAREFEEIVVGLDLIMEHPSTGPYLRELMSELHKEATRRSVAEAK